MSSFSKLTRLSTLSALALCACSGGSGVTDAPLDTQRSPQQPLLAVFPQASGVHVSGTRIVNASGTAIRLRGVNRSGTEYACAQGNGIFDGPSDSASVRAIAQWHANVVRVPMNEDCWLAINGVKSAYAGANYQRAIANYVTTLNRYGIVAILELHWSAAGGTLALKQDPMPNRDHSVEFWRQVANAYKGNTAVIFDLFNEPFPDNNRDTPEAWRCWKNGGSCSGMSFQAAGMQELVNAVRGTGAKNVIMLGGVNYSARLSHWLANKPTDSAKNLVASWHVYNFSDCNNRTCWDNEALPVSRSVPLLLGELGQNDRGSAFINSLMDWMDAINGSYLAWSWDVWGQNLDLITNYNGTASSYGTTFKTRLSRP